MIYQVVRAGSTDDLAELVNALLRDGWVVAGGVAVEVYHYYDRDNNFSSAEYYLQALTKVTT